MFLKTIHNTKTCNNLDSKSKALFTQVLNWGGPNESWGPGVGNIFKMIKNKRGAKRIRGLRVNITF